MVTRRDVVSASSAVVRRALAIAVAGVMILGFGGAASAHSGPETRAHATSSTGASVPGAQPTALPSPASDGAERQAMSRPPTGAVPGVLGVPGGAGMGAPGGAGQVTRVVFVDLGIGHDAKADTIGGVLGVSVRAEVFAKALPLLQEARADVVVVRVNCAGGDPAEVMAIRDVLRKQYASEFRVVAWVRSAMEVAAMSAWLFDEVYMMPSGVLGGFALSAEKLSRVPMDKWEAASLEAGRDPKVFAAVFQSKGLSMSISDMGQTQLFADATAGKVMLNPNDNPGFTLNSRDAMLLRVSRGIASTDAELMAVMGIDRHEIVGQKATEFVQQATREGEAAFKEAQSLVSTIDKALADARAKPGEAQHAARLLEVNRAKEAHQRLSTLISKWPALEHMVSPAPRRGTIGSWMRVAEQDIKVLATPSGR